MSQTKSPITEEDLEDDNSPFRTGSQVTSVTPVYPTVNRALFQNEQVEYEEETQNSILSNKSSHALVI
jgi:hypothetical protein